MEIRIGIVQSMKEIDVELPDDADRDKVMKEVEEALERARRCSGSPTARAVVWACRRRVLPTWSWVLPPASAL